MSDTQRMMVNLFEATAAYVRWYASPGKKGDAAYLIYEHCLEVLARSQNNPPDIAALVEEYINQ